MTIISTAPVLTSTGISAPSYADILTYLQEQFLGIFGADIYIDPDSQDGQWLAIQAQAISDANSVAVAVYNSFSPSTSQGNSLSSNVKLNGITRQIATKSTCPVVIVGQANAVIVNGIAGDSLSNQWALPASFSIPNSGTITVTATCSTLGAISAATNSITKILTPQLGWQSVNNAVAATVGAPIESDAALRQRQAVSSALPAQSVLGGIAAAIAAVPGVTRFVAYENPTGTTDSNGLPAHSFAVVAEGGDPTAICQSIANKKTIGAATYGTTSVSITNAFGLPSVINFFIVTKVRIVANVYVHPINGYTTVIGAEIQAAVAAYINSIAIGNNVFLSRLYVPATLAQSGNADGNTYELLSVAIAAYPASPIAADVSIAFNAVASCNPVDITIIVS